MVTEGTYPQAFGGVSVWCDQIVRGLPEHQFQVQAICSSGTEPAAWELPPNVTVRRIPLWTVDSGRRMGRAVRWAAEDAYRRLLYTLVSEPDRHQVGFADALAELCRLAQRYPLHRVVHGERAVGWLRDAWREQGLTPRATVFDAAQITQLLTHWLRPLLRPAPRGEVSHAVTNGLAALVALAAKWVYGTPMLFPEHGVYLRERYLGFRESPYPWPVRAALLAFQRQLGATAYRCADLITPGNRYNHRWEVRLGADPERIMTVYNGVDPTDFPRPGGNRT